MFSYDQQQKIAEYCRHRIAQCEAEQRTIDGFEEEHFLNPAPYIRGLENVIREIEETKNDPVTRERNVRYLCPSLFWRDITAIMRNEALDLPEELLQIPPYLAEIERQEREEQKRMQEEQEAKEYKRLYEINKQKEAENKERREQDLCAKLGISRAALRRLQSEA